MPGGRSVSIKVLVTPATAAQLRLKANGLGVTTQRLMVESALSEHETITDRRNLLGALYGLRSLVAAMGNNINQLARKANLEDEFPEEARPVLERIDAMLDRVEESLDRVRASR